jgi:hypothetical protein
MVVDGRRWSLGVVDGSSMVVGGRWWSSMGRRWVVDGRRWSSMVVEVVDGSSMVVDGSSRVVNGRPGSQKQAGAAMKQPEAARSSQKQPVKTVLFEYERRHSATESN